MELILPSIISFTVPVIVGLVFGVAALGAFLAGAILSGFVFAIMMSNAGGAWDNAKKWIEEGNLGGKGTETHKAAITGDTVGDPFKDTSGPSINTLLVVMSLTSSVFMGLMLAVGADGLIGGLLDPEEYINNPVAIWVILLVLLCVVLAGILIWAIMKIVKHPKVMEKIAKKKD